jgi:hypothetical protein
MHWATKAHLGNAIWVDILRIMKTMDIFDILRIMKTVDIIDILRMI